MLRLSLLVFQSGVPVVYQRENPGEEFSTRVTSESHASGGHFFHSKMWRLFHAVVLASFLTCCFAASNGTIPAVLWHGMGE